MCVSDYLDAFVLNNLGFIFPVLCWGSHASIASQQSFCDIARPILVYVEMITPIQLQFVTLQPDTITYMQNFQSAQKGGDVV